MTIDNDLKMFQPGDKVNYRGWFAVVAYVGQDRRRCVIELIATGKKKTVSLDSIEEGWKK